VAQLVALTAITLTAATTVDTLRLAAAADVAADRGAGPRVAVPARHVRAAAPVAVSVPRLGLRSTLVQLRKQRTGALEVPKDPAQAGWYVGSSHPGDPGPTVLAGHVDSRTGPGVFFHLDRLRKGDSIFVRRADGSTVPFVVTAVLRTPKSRFPTELVYVGDRTPSLRLITCGGAFDRRFGHYLDNVVVLAVPA
jgi:hypothetical protein